MSNLTSRIRQLERQFAAEKTQARRESFQSFSEELVQDGKISRDDQPGLVEFMLSLPDGSGAEFLQKFLSDRPKVAEFSESPELQNAIVNARRQYESSWRNRT